MNVPVEEDGIYVCSENKVTHNEEQLGIHGANYS